MTHKKNPVIALVGPDGCGKSSLIREMTRIFSPDQLRPITIVGTRPQRDDDDGYYANITRTEFEERRQRGEFMAPVEHGTDWYGTTALALDSVPDDCFAIRPMLERVVDMYRSEGRSVYAIRIEPTGTSFSPRRTNPVRELQDTQRRSHPLEPDHVIVNSFGDTGEETPNGLRDCADALGQHLARYFQTRAMMRSMPTRPRQLPRRVRDELMPSARRALEADAAPPDLEALMRSGHLTRKIS